jgi:hypothetical protein
VIVRSGSGWQYILADLSLILFMVTAAALAQAQDVAPPPPVAKARPPKLSVQGEPVAIYRSVPNAPPLHDWLRDQLTDPRQHLTIVSQYRPGGQVDAMMVAQNLAQDAGEAGEKARIVVEPGSEAATAVLAFDGPAGK